MRNGGHYKSPVDRGRLHAALFFDELLDAKRELADILLLATAYQALLQAEKYRKLFVLYSPLSADIVATSHTQSFVQIIS